MLYKLPQCQRLCMYDFENESNCDFKTMKFNLAIKSIKKRVSMTIPVIFPLLAC